MPCVLRDIGPDNSSAARLSGLFDDKASAAALDDTSAELLKEALQTAVDMAVDTDFSFDPEKTYDFLKENTPGLQEIDDAVNYYQMKKQIAGFREEVHAFNDTLLDQFLYAKCPDGSYRLSKDDMERYGSVLSSMKMSIDQSFDSCDDNLEAFRLQLLTTCVTDLATMVMGNCLKYFAGGKVKVNSKNAKYFESNLSDKELKKFGINSANAKKIRNFAKNTNDFVEKYGDEIAGFAQNLIDKYGEGVFPEKLEFNQSRKG